MRVFVTAGRLLAALVLAGVAVLAAAYTQRWEIEVAFEINSEGIVSVSARDKETGLEQSITVTASGGLTPEELKNILEQQADTMLEARISSELEQKRNALSSAAAEVSSLIPRVRQLTGSSEFGREALRRAEERRKAAADVPVAPVVPGVAVPADDRDPVLAA